MEKSITEKFDEWFDITNNPKLKEIPNSKMLSKLLSLDLKKVEISDYSKTFKELENNLKLFINTESKEIIGILLNVKEFGGRPGLVHGGFSFSILYLLYSILKKEFYPDDQYFKSKTNYKQKITINTFVKLVCRKESNQYVSRIFDENDKILVELIIDTNNKLNAKF